MFFYLCACATFILSLHRFRRQPTMEKKITGTAANDTSGKKCRHFPHSSGQAVTITTITSDTTDVTGRLHGHSGIVQNYVLVWLDANIDSSDHDFCNSLNQLRRVVNTIDVYKEADPCVEYLCTIKDEKIFLIISGAFGETVIPLIHDGFNQLDSIIIFCDKKERHEEWARKWPKVKGVHTEIIPICDVLEQAARQCDHDAVPMSFLATNASSKASGQQQKQNVDQLDSSYMYTQLFKDIFLEIDDDQTKDIENLVSFCNNQDFNANQIDEFRRKYDPNSAIRWYTWGGFLYKMLNWALRTLEVDTIMNIGFFIRHLHRHIERLHREQSTNFKSVFTVYRGQNLSKDDFPKLCQTKGGLMSFNNFLSTSLDENVSMMFVNQNPTNTDSVGILFIMQIDPNLSKAPFALVSNSVGYFGDEEQEILFSMHTVFRVDDIKQVEKNNHEMWVAHLTLTADNDPQLDALTKHMQEDFDGIGWNRLGQLLMKLGESKKGEQVYKMLLEQAPNEKFRALYSAQFGSAKYKLGEYEEAIQLYQQSIAIQEGIQNPNFQDLATAYNCIGLVYNDVGEYSKALSFYEKALDFFERTLSPNHPLLATSYSCIGRVYDSMGEYSKALSFYEKVLDIFERTLPPIHPDFASSYSNIGLMYGNMGEYSKALSFQEKALDIRLRTLPLNHPDLATSYNNIGLVYNNMGEFSKALSFYEKALDINQRTLPPNHPDLATSYNNIGGMYDRVGEYSKALSAHEKALDIHQITLPPNHPLLATCYHNIGGVYDGIGEYSKALSFYEKGLDVFERTLPPIHPYLATSYNCIGCMYRNMGEYSKAVSFYEKALDIRQRTFPPNHPLLATSYNNIGLVYNNMGEYSKALSLYEKALDIYQKALPPNHPDLATSYLNIGEVCMNMAENFKALSCLQKALIIYEKTLPPTHPDIANCKAGIKLLKKRT